MNDKSPRLSSGDSSDEHPAVYRDAHGITRLRVDIDDRDAAEQELQAKHRTDNPPIDPEIQQRMQEIGDRLSPLVPEPGEQDHDEQRLHQAFASLFKIAPDRPDILDALDRISQDPSIIKKDGICIEGSVDIIESLAANPDLSARPAEARAKPAGASATAAFAESARLFGLTPPPGEPDPRELWLNGNDPLDPAARESRTPSRLSKRSRTS